VNAYVATCNLSHRICDFAKNAIHAGRKVKGHIRAENTTALFVGKIEKSKHRN
jgi:hypothetical protein